MADIKISQLNYASVVSGTDVLPIVVGSSSPCTLTTKQASVAQIVSGGFVNSQISQSIALGISAPSASLAIINAWTSSLSSSVQSINGITSSFLLSASFNSWTGSAASVFYGTSSNAVSASHALVSDNAVSASNALTASYINVVGKEITVNWIGGQLQLTSSQAENQNLQSSTTFGNQTSQSIQLIGSASLTAAGGITGSLLGTAATASYVNVVGQYITVNRIGSQIQLTGSDASTFVTTSSFGAYTASVNLWSSSLSQSVQAINLWSSSVLLSALTSSFVFTSSYNVDSASWNVKDADIFASESITSASNAVINLWTSSLSESVQAINLWSSSVLLNALTGSFVFTSSYNIDSASWNVKDADIFASESITSASNAVINLWTSSLSESVQSINNWSSSLSESVQAINVWSSSVLTNAEFIGWTVSNSASFAGTASNAGLLDGRSAANFLTTGSNGANQVVYGGFAFADGAVLSGSNFSGTASVASLANSAITASYVTNAQSASYIALKGKGVIIGPDDPLAITASILTVNGKFPDASGNIATALTTVVIGDSASFVSSGSGAITASIEEGTVFVIAGDPNPNNNGKSFIYDSGSNGVGAWYGLDSFDYVTADARYLRLNGANSPMQGIIDMGGFKISNVANPSLDLDAVNLRTLTASINTATSYYVSTASFNAFTGSYNTGSFTGSFNGALIGTASHANNATNALTASHIDLVGQYITVNKFGSQFQITGSEVAGFLTTSSFNNWTGSAFLPVSNSLLSQSINIAAVYASQSAASASVQAINSVTQSFLTEAEYLVSSSIYITSGSVGGSQTINGSLNVNNLTGSLLGNASTATNAQTASYTINQIFLTASTAISTLDKNINGYGQDGRIAIIGDGASGSVVITTNITSEDNFCAAYMKYGGGAISFAAGAGTTLYQTDNTNLLDGKAGSSATLNRVGNTFYLRINNAS